MVKSDLRTEILVRLGKDTTSAWSSAQIVNSWVDQAHRWAAGYHKWPFTEGRASTTYASLVANDLGDLRGEYPEGWKSDSIRVLSIGGERLEKLNWEDYLIFREEHPDSTERIFSDYGRSYYVNPNADVSGTTTVYGQYTPATLDDESSTDTTVFADEEGNQAIIEEAVSYALRRDGKEQEAVNHHQLAKMHLEELWKRISDEQYNYKSKDRGMWNRVDVVHGEYYDDSINTDQF